MHQLNYLKENVPCVDYMLGFCMDGKECIFLHPKSGENKPPTYKEDECLPQEYIEKVKKYFDDSQISNINMIQSLIMKQMSLVSGGSDNIDINSLLGLQQPGKIGQSGGDIVSSHQYGSSTHNHSRYGDNQT